MQSEQPHTWLSASLCLSLPRDLVLICGPHPMCQFCLLPGLVESPFGTWPASLLPVEVLPPRWNIQSSVNALSHGQHTETSLKTNSG